MQGSQMSPFNSRAVPPSAPASRFANLDALRGLAALSVVLFHFGGELPATWFTALFARGWTGVQIFFVISGFILPCALQARGTYRFPRHYPRFLWKRILRLHPPYLVSVALIVSVWYLSSLVRGVHDQSPPFRWVDLAGHPFLLNDILHLKWVSSVFWTLAIEFQFYLLIAVVFPLLAHPRYWSLAAGGLILAGLFPVSRAWIVPYLPSFVMGILAWKVLRNGAAPWIVTLLGVAAGVVAWKNTGPSATVVSAAAALAVIFWRRGVPRWLTATGTVSYSLYLLHASIGISLIHFAKRFPLDGVPAQILTTAAAMAVSLGAAYLLYLLVERPALRWSSGKRFDAPACAPSPPPGLRGVESRGASPREAALCLSPFPAAEAVPETPPRFPFITP
jgi:peptidoglycan/LPS O-acetylase OafA/YrhL